MSVPKYIKQKMHRVARLTCLARYEMMKVEEWLQEHDIETDYGSSMRCGDGNSLEELEYGNDITDSLRLKIKRSYTDEQQRKDSGSYHEINYVRKKTMFHM